MNRMRKSLAVMLMAVALAPVLSGCVFSPKSKPPVAPDPIPDPSTPQNAIKRFNQTYEQKKAQDYQGMFTGDFTYEFSNSTDPTLVNQYASGWFKNDEKLSSSHLFSGYTPPRGVTLPAATAIDVNFETTTPIDDGAKGGAATYKILTTRVDGSITVPQAGSDPLTYVFTNNLNAFYFVRGDAATGLDSSQPADSGHWYIYRWVDISYLAPESAKTLSQHYSWAGIRAMYRSDTNPSLAANETPQGAIARLIGSYEKKLADEYAQMFTGDFAYEFSNSTDPQLVNQYSTGWFKTDETQSSLHLFQGYTPPGGVTLPAATAISIQLATGTPVDDNSSADPATHKILATRVDGSITVPQAGSDPLTYVFSNNYNAFYLVRGDAAVGLQLPQAPDAYHWYVYRWVDLSEASPVSLRGNRSQSSPLTWGRLKGLYR